MSKINRKIGGIIRKNIKENCVEKKFNEYELRSISRNIIDSVNEVNSGITDHDLYTYITEYIRYSKKDEKYYFNMRRQALNKNKFMKVLTEEINVSDDSEVVESSVSEEHNQNNSDSDIVESSVSEESEVNPSVQEKDVKLVDNRSLIVNDILSEPDDSDYSDDGIDYNNIPEVKLDFESNSERDVRTEEYIDNYEYTKEKYIPVRHSSIKYGPHGSQWVHDQQTDDNMDDLLNNRALQFDKLRAIELPEQRSPAWFAMRNGAITASDGGCVVGVNYHEPRFKFILKKTTDVPFQVNKYCYHGKKLEEPATMIYARRMNVRVDEFGLMIHPKYSFLGASPDGICNRFKYNKKNLSKFVGRMLEIKCPMTRKIKRKGKINGDICPSYYWVQVQLQLECCDLEECDFWQCSIEEYDTREEFIADTKKDEPFMSVDTGFEKGCLIQVIPQSQISKAYGDLERNEGGDYDQVIWEHANFIYPKKIEMTPNECDIWVNETLDKLNREPWYVDNKTKEDRYVFDKVVYWKLNHSHNVTIKRDKKWFAEKLPVFKQTWRYVLFLRKNPQILKIFTKYVDSIYKKYDFDNITKFYIKKKVMGEMNGEIIKFMEELYDTKRSNYKSWIKTVKRNLNSGNTTITSNRVKKNKDPNKSTIDFGSYMFS
jgi:putative phage-type endonuclease